jgi:hypothetical protein
MGRIAKMHTIRTRMHHCAEWLPVYVMGFLLLAVSYSLRLWVLEKQYFDLDEFEHSHGAWLIFKGLLPYRDYFEHHTPWFHFLLAPFFRFFDVETKADDAFSFLFFAREIAWLFTGIILSFTVWLGYVWRDTRVALLSALLLVNTGIFMKAGLEIRPDSLAVVCWLGCLIMVARAVQHDHLGRFQCRWEFACSGACLGVGIMVTQKLLFALPGLAFTMAWYLCEPGAPQTRLTRMRNVAYQLAGLCVPIVLTVAYFYVRGGAHEFIQYNFLFNFRYKERYESDVLYRLLHKLASQNPILVAFGSAGVIRLLPFVFRRGSLRRGDAVLALNALGLFLGAFLIPVPSEQYCLLFLPLVALLAGAFLMEAIDKLRSLRDYFQTRVWSALVTLSILALVTRLALTSRGFVSTPFMGTVALRSPRARSLAFVLFLLALSIPPLLDAYKSRVRQVNTAKIDEIRYVIESTAPTDTVMDGFTGRGVFRPQAYYYFMLHYGVRMMLSEEDKDELLRSLVSGQISPKLIFFDQDLRELSPPIARFFETNYQPTGKGVIWRKKEENP